MQVLSQFINSMIRSAYNDEDRSKNNKLVGTLVRIPERSEFLPEINEQQIVEFYNRA